MSEELNAPVQKWGEETAKLIKGHISAIALKGKGELKRKLRSKIGYRFGDAESISFLFPRHGIILLHGAGRGYVVVNKKLVRGVKTKEGAFMPLQGALKRGPKDWLNPVLDKQVEILADIVADINANLVIKSTELK